MCTLLSVYANSACYLFDSESKYVDWYNFSKPYLLVFVFATNSKSRTMIQRYIWFDIWMREHISKGSWTLLFLFLFLFSSCLHYFRFSFQILIIYSFLEFFFFLLSLLHNSFCFGYIFINGDRNFVNLTLLLLYVFHNSRWMIFVCGYIFYYDIER